MVFQNTLHLPRELLQLPVNFILPLLRPPQLLHFPRFNLNHHPPGHLLHQNRLHFQIKHFIHLQLRMLLIHHLILQIQIQIQTQFNLQFKLIILIQFMRIFLFFVWQVPFYGQVNLLPFF